MNMPIDDKRQVHFTTTLFALIRESLGIKMRTGNFVYLIIHTRKFHLAAEEMDEADNELRQVIIKLWPNIARKSIKLHEGGTKTLLDLVVPPKTGKIKFFSLFQICFVFFIFRITWYTWSSEINCWKSLCSLFIYRQLSFI
jgi:hypothetical protein